MTKKLKIQPGLAHSIGLRGPQRYLRGSKGGQGENTHRLKSSGASERILGLFYELAIWTARMVMILALSMGWLVRLIVRLIGGLLGMVLLTMALAMIGVVGILEMAEIWEGILNYGW